MPLTNLALADLPMSKIPNGELPAIAQTKAIGFVNGIVTQQAMMHRSKGAPAGGGAAH